VHGTAIAGDDNGNGPRSRRRRPGCCIRNPTARSRGSLAQLGRRRNVGHDSAHHQCALGSLHAAA